MLISGVHSDCARRVTGAGVEGRCAAVRHDDRHQQQQFGDPTVEAPLVLGEPVRWPEPSTLANWWQQILFGEREAM